VVTLRYVAEVEQTAARWAAQQGQDAGPLFAAADVALRKVIAADGKDADGLRRMAELQRYHAEWLLARHRPTALVLREGLELAERAGVLEPDLAEGSAITGALRLAAARAAPSVEDRVRQASQAQAALQLALARNGFLKRQYGPLLDEATRLSRP
jgi:serine/threonine-protein kinase